MKALETIHKVCTQGRGESFLAKVYIYCFGDVILLFKMLTRGRGVKYLTYLSVQTLWMAPYSKALKFFKDQNTTKFAAATKNLKTNYTFFV